MGGAVRCGRGSRRVKWEGVLEMGGAIKVSP